MRRISVPSCSCTARTSRDRPAGADAADASWQARSRAPTRRPVYGRLGAAAGVLSAGEKVGGSWTESSTAPTSPGSLCSLAREDCQACPARPLCTPGAAQSGAWNCHPREQMRRSRPRGRGMPVRRGTKPVCAPRGDRRDPLAGGPGLRAAATRYWGLEKTHLQHVATAAAINIDRIVAWLDERPRAQDADLPFRRACSRLRPTRWDTP